MFKNHFYYELDTDEWTQIILSRIHDRKFWIQDNVVDVSINPIHEVTGLSKEGSVPIGEKLVKKKVESYTKVVYNGKSMVISSIKQDDVRFLSKIIAYLVFMKVLR